MEPYCLMFNELKAAKEWIYDRCGFELRNLKLIPESKDYSACLFELNGSSVQYRVSKITPKKNGQFVAIWKRNPEGITVPFDISDPLDYIIIAVKEEDNFGQFIFPSSVLAEKGIISKNNQGGKRGIRVYPPWVTAMNKQAEKTQNWQLSYFLDIHSDGAFELNRAKQLLSQA